MTLAAALPSLAPPPPRFVRRLGPHHLAHLRAGAEGLDLADCAWRLVSLPIRVPGGKARPSLEAFARQHGLEVFSESEVVKLYEEAYPLERQATRGQRLRERQLALLRRLEGLAVETPQPADLVAGWFEEALAAKWVTAGLLTLGALSATPALWCALSSSGAFSAHAGSTAAGQAVEPSAGGDRCWTWIRTGRPCKAGFRRGRGRWPPCAFTSAKPTACCCGCSMNAQAARSQE